MSEDENIRTVRSSLQSGCLPIANRRELTRQQLGLARIIRFSHPLIYVLMSLLTYFESIIAFCLIVLLVCQIRFARHQLHQPERFDE